MKTKKNKKTTVAIAALMGMTTAINPAFPTVHAQSMNDQNPTESQTDATPMDQTQTEDPKPQQDLTYSKDAQPVEENTKEAPVTANVQKATGDIEINKTTFPDDVFRSWIIENVASAKDGVLTPEEIAKVTSINIKESSTSGLTNLEGIENFTALRDLYVAGVDDTSIDSLDLRGNVNLANLSCTSSHLKNISLPANNNMVNIDLGKNDLTSIDVSKNENLSTLDLSYNQIQDIHLEENRKLWNVHLNNNSLSSLNLKNSTNLHELHCYNNQLTELKLPQSQNLTEVSVSSNNLSSLDISNLSKLNFLDCINNKNLKSLTAKENTNLSTLRFSNLTSFNASLFPAIQKLSIIDSDLTSLDLSQNSSLKTLTLENSKIESLDFSNNPALETFSATTTKPNTKSSIRSINVTNNHQLKTFECTSSQLSELDLSNNENLNELNLRNNNFTSINVSHNSNLEKLRLGENQLNNIDLTQNTMLKILVLSNNKFSSLDLSKNLSLTSITLDNNVLTTLKLNNPYLTQLDIGNNEITSLDVKGCPKLDVIWGKDNKLTSIDIKSNPLLTVLDLEGNKLTSLDVTENTALNTLHVNGNHLYFLDLSENINLQNLYCKDNNLIALSLPENTSINIKDASNGFISNKSFTIPVTPDGSYDLAKLDPMLTAEHLEGKVRELTNADAIEGTVLKGIEPEKDITYKYTIGNNTPYYIDVKLSTLYGNYWLKSLDIENWTYGEKANTPTAKPAYGDDVTFSYSDKKDGTYVTDTDNLFTHAGTWYVKAEAIDSTHGTITAVKSFEIYKANPKTIEIPTGLTSTSGNTLSSITLPDGWAWQDSSEIVTVKNDGYKASYKVDDINYDYSKVEGYDEGNHCITKVLSITASKAENAWVKEISASDWTQNETAVLPTAKSKYGTVSFLYSNSKTGTFKSEVPKTAGTWYVKAVVSEGDEYLGISSNVISFTIKEPKKEDTDNKNDKNDHTDIDVIKPIPVDEIKKEPAKEEIKETTPSPIKETGDVASNPAKFLLVFLTGCLACFKKKVSEE